MISKVSCGLTSRGKSLQGYTWGRIFCTKKMSFMTYIMLKSNLTPLCVREKNLTQTKSPIPPSHTKFKMVNHIGVGEEVDLTP